MRITDLKQILWWLAAGLLICTGVLAGLIVLRPSRGHAGEFSRWAATQLAQARKVELGRQSASWDFRKTYAATYAVKIDGVAPPVEVPVYEEPTRTIEKARRPLADFIDVIALWTDVAFYRLKSRADRVEDVAVGKTIPPAHVPELGAEAKLLRIECARSPFRAVFLVHGAEEVFVIPQAAVLLDRVAQASAPAAEGDYRGPPGAVSPLVRTVAPVGIKVSDRGVELGRDIQDMVSTDPESFFRDVAWDSTRQGIAVVKIVKGSRLDLLLRETGGILQEGDVVARVNGVQVESKAQIINHFKQHPLKVGTPVVVEILRKGRTVTQTFYVPRK
ncbi:MAG: hypothetical protein JXQ29_00445 [Planctomycetes bacterium]|nr:hypothetical protein [Planctomycetota bacterium]